MSEKVSGTQTPAKEAELGRGEQDSSAKTAIAADVQLVMPDFSGQIQGLEDMVQAVSEDPASTMSGLEQVQNGLIENLDRLNKYIEDYVEVLGNSRKQAA